MLHPVKSKFFLKEKLETNAMEVAKEKLKLFQLQVLLKFKLMQFKETMRNVFTQGKVGRYLDDWVLEDEVFREQDQLMRPSI